MPWKRRWLLARRPELASSVHTVALRTIEQWYAAAGGAPKSGRTGAVTATQRFGSDARVSFRRVVPYTEDIERLVVRRRPSRDPTGLATLAGGPR